jgi:hypothetical protein
MRVGHCFGLSINPKRVNVLRVNCENPVKANVVYHQNNMDESRYTIVVVFFCINLLSFPVLFV